MATRLSRGSFQLLSNNVLEINAVLQLIREELDGIQGLKGAAKIFAELEIDGALNHDGAALGVFGATPVVQQVSGANITNNVTSGGTNDTIANFTDLTTYSNSAAAIRNDIYQLARNLKQVNDALRLYGLLT